MSNPLNPCNLVLMFSTIVCWPAAMFQDVKNEDHRWATNQTVEERQIEDERISDSKPHVQRDFDRDVEERTRDDARSVASAQIRQGPERQIQKQLEQAQAQLDQAVRQAQAQLDQAMQQAAQAQRQIEMVERERAQRVRQEERNDRPRIREFQVPDGIPGAEGPLRFPTGPGSTATYGGPGPRNQSLNRNVSRNNNRYETRGPTNEFNRVVIEHQRVVEQHNGEIQMLSDKLRSAESDDQKTTLKEQIKKELEAQYDLYLEQHEAPLKQLESRLEKLRSDFEWRKKAKEDLVKLRLDTIWYDSQGLAWPGQPQNPNRGYVPILNVPTWPREMRPDDFPMAEPHPIPVTPAER